jgi:thiamine-phosphate pyrophosphorylase
MTPAVARALQLAQVRACTQAPGGQVRPEDVLSGLLEEAEGRAATLLARAGADLRAFSREFVLELQVETDSVPPLPFEQSCLTIFDRAAELAAEWTTEHTVSSDALLVALLRQEPEIRRQLESFGLQWDLFEAQLPAATKPPIELDEPLAIAETTERIDLARIVDANANRAREALRAVEDYCRFALDDAFLSRETKQLRHDLAEALADFPSNLLLEARETQRDVGTGITSSAEQSRHSLGAVVRANLKRLQEALRSLEEHGKIVDPRVGSALERLRYRTYTLERCVLLGTDARERLAEAKLYVLLTGARCAASLDWTIQEAAAGGARMFQLREKELDDRALLERARKVRKWTRQAGALFIVNDRPDIARLADADGVHLGQEDMPVQEARRILGPDKLIGVSTHDFEQLRQAIQDGASYVGVGPAFPSETKEFAEFAGLDFVRRAAAETSLPAFVIGGVNANTIGAAVAAGAKRVAVSQAVCNADDPRAAAATLLRALDG